jgi:hypothetical protein
MCVLEYNMSNLSKAMKEFWSKKSKEELAAINNIRKKSNSECIYVKKEGRRAQACKPELIFDKLSLGYKIINTEKNILKLKKYFEEIPEEFFIN